MGDNLFIVCYVVQELYFIEKVYMLILQFFFEKGWQCEWCFIDGSIVLFLVWGFLKVLVLEYVLCFIGDGLVYLQVIDFQQLFCFIFYVQVFVCVVFKQKEFVIISLKELGYVIFMCGDGINDVGVLKYVDVGVVFLVNVFEWVVEW